MKGSFRADESRRLCRRFFIEWKYPYGQPAPGAGAGTVST